MRIPTYQIHNVLNTYCKKITRSKISESREDQTGAEIANSSNGQVVSPDECKTIVSKIETDIIERIMHGVIHQQAAGSKDTAEFNADTTDDNELNDHFVFNAVDKNNVKTTHRLSWTDSNFLSASASRSPRPTPACAVDAAPPVEEKKGKSDGISPNKPLIKRMMQETKPEMAPVDKAGTIEEIKEAYQTGLYFINAEKIAEKIVTFHSGIPV